jgi:hypothetical protein
MVAIIVTSLPAGVFALGLIARLAGCGPNIDCSAKLCINAPRSQPEISLCKAALSDACGSPYAALEECVRRQDICTDGMLDGVKTTAAYNQACAQQRTAFRDCIQRVTGDI